MNLENERKDFEEWAKSKCWSIARSTEPNYSHKYREAITQCAWESWIASANREGYKLVPVVDSDAMWSAGRVIIEENGYCTDASDIYKAMIGACDE